MSLISVEEHLATVLGAARPLPPRSVPLAKALGCVLAQDVAATLAVPPFTNSAMDGYAVPAADVAAASAEEPVRLRVLGDQPAGHTGAPAVEPGTAVRVMTGALLPAAAPDVPGGAEALGIVPVEDTDQAVVPGAPLPDVVSVVAPTEAGRHVRRAGEDVAPGDRVVRAGTLLGPRDLSALASTGHGSVPVHPTVRVGIVGTGDELVDAGTVPAEGQIPDSNSILLAGLVREVGGEPVVLPRSSDSPDALRALLAEAMAGTADRAPVDAIVTTGGVSAGAYDVVKEVLEPLGDVVFTKVAMQPGKPQGFGVLDGGVPIFCLPGNPVSVFVSFQLFVEPALARMAARFDGPTPEIEAVAAAGWRSPAGRRQYIPVVVQLDDVGGTSAGSEGGGADAADGGPGGVPGELRVAPATAGGSGSHLIASLCLAEALAIVPEDVTEVREGDRVRVMMAL